MKARKERCDSVEGQGTCKVLEIDVVGDSEFQSAEQIARLAGRHKLNQTSLLSLSLHQAYRSNVMRSCLLSAEAIASGTQQSDDRTCPLTSSTLTDLWGSSSLAGVDGQSAAAFALSHFLRASLWSISFPIRGSRKLQPPKATTRTKHRIQQASST